LWCPAKRGTHGGGSQGVIIAAIDVNVSSIAKPKHTCGLVSGVAYKGQSLNGPRKLNSRGGLADEADILTCQNRIPHIQVAADDFRQFDRIARTFDGRKVGHFDYHIAEDGIHFGKVALGPCHRRKLQQEQESKD